jgi:hypothetical protein
MKTSLFQSISIALLLTASSIGLAQAAYRFHTQGTEPIDPQGVNASLNVIPLTDAGSLPLAQPQLSQAPTTHPRFDLCVDLPDWQRPNDQAQEKHLQSIPRYRDALQEEPLLSLAKAWWSHEIFTFTTYGLSARTDPHYLSGIWSALDVIWDCYDGDQPRLINQGDMAELWLLHHRLVDIQWLGEEYVVTVEPATSGLQLVHFERHDTYAELPVSVVTTDGEPIAAMSGDW